MRHVFCALVVIALLASCSGYESHKATLEQVVVENLGLKSADCMQTGENEYTLDDGRRVYPSKAFDEGIVGFSGPTHLFVVVDAEGKITNVIAGENAETTEFFNKLSEAGLFDKWNGLTLAEAADKEVDAASGATLSSTAVIKTVKATAAGVK